MNDTVARRLGALPLDLVRVPSPSGEEARLALMVENRLRAAAGCAWVRRHGNAVVAVLGKAVTLGSGAVLGGSDPRDSGLAPASRPSVILAGHLDTVPLAGHPEPRMEGDRVVGLGTTDMKGALAVMLDLAENPLQAMRPTGLVFYDCEEVDFERNGLHTLFEKEPWLAKADLALLLEPTANELEVGCLGTLHARVTFRGRAAHSARPWFGENAIHKAAPFLSRLAAMEPRDVSDGPVVFREVVSATLASGGATRNVVPDSFTLNVNLRFTPDRDTASAETYLRSLIPADAEVEIVDLAPSAPARLEGGLLEEFSRGLAVRAKQAWTDVAQFSGHGVPAANFGPGIPELAHREDEFVPLENLVRCRDTLARFLSGESS